MRNRASAKKAGSLHERLTAEYLVSRGFPWASKRAKSGSKDRGDINGVPGVVLEAKDCASITLGAFMKEAEIEAKNDKCSWFAVIIKRRMKPIQESYAVTTFEQYVTLLRYREYALRGGVGGVECPAEPTFEDGKASATTGESS